MNTGLSDILGIEADGSELDQRSFDLHGIRLTVRGNSPFLLDAVEQALAYYSLGDSCDSSEMEFLLLDHLISESVSSALFRNAVLHFDSEVDDEQGIARSMGLRFKYYTLEALELADFGPTGQLYVDPARGRGIVLMPPLASSSPRTVNYLFSLGLASLLRTRGRYIIHAAGLAENGKGVVVPGISASGKTTLSLTLVRGGFHFLGDDRLVFEQAEDRFRVFGMLENVNVTDATISLFPEIRRLPEKAFGASPRKKNFPVELAYPDCILESCVPEILVFPTIVDESVSRAEPMSKMEAIVGLLPHSLLVLDQEVARSHFQLLCNIVQNTRCYRLYFGRDFDEVPNLIRELL